MEPTADFFARETLGLTHEQASAVPLREAAQGFAHQLGPLAAQRFAFRVVAVAGQQCRWSHPTFAALVACTVARTLERLPPDELTAPQFVHAGVARDAKQPGF